MCNKNHPIWKTSFDDDDMFDELANLYVHDDKSFAVSTSDTKLSSSIVPLPAHKTEVSSTYVPPDLDMDPYFLDQQTSILGQVHKLNESISPQKHQFNAPTSTIHKCGRGILPTPYVPYCLHHIFILTNEHRFSSAPPNLETFKSFKSVLHHINPREETRPVLGLQKEDLIGR